MSELWDGKETLVPDALRGYRGWQVRDGQLHSTGVSHFWTAPEVSARCLAHPVDGGFDPDCPCDLCRSNTHLAPVRDCTCGIYGWYSPSDTRLVEADVFGAVEATGRVVLASHGFRAAHARIAALAITSPYASGNFSALYSRAIYGREAPSPTDLHDLARWAKTQGIPVFRDRAELVAAFPPQDVASLVDHDCDETCRAAEKKPAASLMGSLGTLTFTTSGSAAYTSVPYLRASEASKPRWWEPRSRFAFWISVAFLLLALAGTAMALTGMVRHGVSGGRVTSALVNTVLAGYWSFLLWHRRRKPAADVDDDNEGLS